MALLCQVVRLWGGLGTAVDQPESGAGDLILPTLVLLPAQEAKEEHEEDATAATQLAHIEVSTRICRRQRKRPAEQEMDLVDHLASSSMGGAGIVLCGQQRPPGGAVGAGRAPAASGCRRARLSHLQVSRRGREAAAASGCLSGGLSEWRVGWTDDRGGSAVAAARPLILTSAGTLYDNEAGLASPSRLTVLLLLSPCSRRLLSVGSGRPLVEASLGASVAQALAESAEGWELSHRYLGFLACQ